MKSELEEALELRDNAAVERAIENAYHCGLTIELVPALLALLPETFHTRHEDIVRALQALKDPRAVNALYDAALVEHPYLDYDENFGLARRCTWALADIGTPEARLALEKLEKNPNAHIAGYARRRLASWEKELGRKGASS